MRALTFSLLVIVTTLGLGCTTPNTDSVLKLNTNGPIEACFNNCSNIFSDNAHACSPDKNHMQCQSAWQNWEVCCKSKCEPSNGDSCTATGSPSNCYPTSSRKNDPSAYNCKKVPNYVSPITTCQNHCGMMGWGNIDKNCGSFDDACINSYKSWINCCDKKCTDTNGDSCTSDDGSMADKCYPTKTGTNPSYTC